MLTQTQVTGETTTVRPVPTPGASPASRSPLSSGQYPSASPLSSGAYGGSLDTAHLPQSGSFPASPRSIAGAPQSLAPRSVARSEPMPYKAGSRALAPPGDSEMEPVQESGCASVRPVSRSVPEGPASRARSSPPKPALSVASDRPVSLRSGSYPPPPPHSPASQAPRSPLSSGQHPELRSGQYPERRPAPGQASPRREKQREEYDTRELRSGQYEEVERQTDGKYRPQSRR